MQPRAPKTVLRRDIHARAALLLVAAVCAASTSLSACKQRTSAAVETAPAPSLLTKARADSPRLNDPQWKLAAEGDPAELARLANREGARGLLEGVEDGGDISRTALSALAFADDSELAFGRLGQIAVQLAPSEVMYVLDALSAIAYQPHRQTEPLDREGIRTCIDSLREIAGRKREPARARASAISTLRVFADRHWVDPNTIPSDLDPPVK